MSSNYRCSAGQNTVNCLATAKLNNIFKFAKISSKKIFNSIIMSSLGGEVAYVCHRSFYANSIRMSSRPDGNSIVMSSQQ